VTFEPVEGAIYERIDDAYRGKYYGSPYLSSMGEQPRSFRDSQDRPAREQCLTMAATRRIPEMTRILFVPGLVSPIMR
jgi:hypothetical protein